MTTKTITVTENAYASIKGLKSANESFSDLFLRISKERSIAEKYFGILKSNARELQGRFRKMRTESDKEMRKRENVLIRHLGSN